MSEMMAMINAAIEKNLSAEIGTALKERLAKADQDAIELRQAKADVQQMKEESYKQKDRADRLARDHDAMMKRCGDLDGREKALAIREATIELREGCASARIADMKYIVEAVFANNRFKYSMTGYMPAGCDQYGNAQTASVHRDVEGEG
jgi:hypothetical protein